MSVLRMPLLPRVEEKEQKPKRERGEGMIWKRGNVWWIQFYLQGRAVRESSGSDVKQVAKELLHKRLTEAKEGAVADGKLRYDSMRDYLYKDYETRKCKSLLTMKDGETRYICSVPALDEFFKDYKARDITTEEHKKFIRHRQAQGIGNEGINGSTRMLRRMFMLQVKERRFPRNLVPYLTMLPKANPRRDFLTPDQNASLVKHLPEDLRPLQVVAYDTGARKGELLKLKWDDVDLQRGTLLFRNTKNSTDRLVPLGQKALETLKEMKVVPGSPVFTRNGRPIKDFRRAWEKALEDSGIKGHHVFHGNRRSQAVNLMTAGVDEQTAMEITGHKDSQTFRGYRVLIEEAKRAAIAKRDSVVSVTTTVTAAKPRNRKSR